MPKILTALIILILNLTSGIPTFYLDDSPVFCFVKTKTSFTCGFAMICNKIPIIFFRNDSKRNLACFLFNEAGEIPRNGRSFSLMSYSEKYFFSRKWKPYCRV